MLKRGTISLTEDDDEDEDEHDDEDKYNGDEEHRKGDEKISNKFSLFLMMSAILMPIEKTIS